MYLFLCYTEATNLARATFRIYISVNGLLIRCAPKINKRCVFFVWAGRAMWLLQSNWGANGWYAFLMPMGCIKFAHRWLCNNSACKWLILILHIHGLLCLFVQVESLNNACTLLGTLLHTRNLIEFSTNGNSSSSCKTTTCYRELARATIATAAATTAASITCSQARLQPYHWQLDCANT